MARDETLPDAQPDSGEWIPVDGVSEPLDEFEMTELDLVADMTHSVRGPVMRRLRSPHTVAEVAAALDVPITRLYHHVNRLEDLGLIRVVATRRVGAVTERRYQVTARSWKLAPSVFDTSDPRELGTAFASLFDVAKSGLEREIENGLFDDLPVSDERLSLSLGEFRLRPETHHRLIARLGELLQEFESDADDDDPDATRTTLFIAAYTGS